MVSVVANLVSSPSKQEAVQTSGFPFQAGISSPFSWWTHHRWCSLGPIPVAWGDAELVTDDRRRLRSKEQGVFGLIITWQRRKSEASCHMTVIAGGANIALLCVLPQRDTEEPGSPQVLPSPSKRLLLSMC